MTKAKNNLSTQSFSKHTCFIGKKTKHFKILGCGLKWWMNTIAWNDSTFISLIRNFWKHNLLPNLLGMKLNIQHLNFYATSVFIRKVKMLVLLLLYIGCTLENLLSVRNILVHDTSCHRFLLMCYNSLSFNKTGISLWNSLPVDVKKCSSISSFKKCVKSSLFHRMQAANDCDFVYY